MPAPSTSTPTTIPPQLMGGVLSSTLVSARNADGSTCEQRLDRQVPPSRVRSRPIRWSTCELQPARRAVARGGDLDPVLDVALVDLLDAEEVDRFLALDLALEHRADEGPLGARQVANEVDAQAAARERVGRERKRGHQ